MSKRDDDSSGWLLLLLAGLAQLRWPDLPLPLPDASRRRDLRSNSGFGGGGHSGTWTAPVQGDDDFAPRTEIPISPGVPGPFGNEGRVKPQRIPTTDLDPTLLPRGGIWRRVAPDRKGIYRLQSGPWYCVCLEWPVVEHAPSVEEIANVFRPYWRALMAWDDPDQQSLVPSGQRRGYTLSTAIPITRELALGRVWLLGVCKPGATLRHERVVECWRRYASDVVG